MTATTSTRRIDANRRDAQRSTGPRTPEGKSRARLNALKHGLTAALPVLTGEDADALQARVDAWKEDVRPRGPLESYLVERAAHASWQLERAERTIAARLRDDVNRDAARRARAEVAEVASLDRRLFGEPRDPARLVDRLERTASGCRWLLDCWGELRRILDDGRKWGPAERLRAVRLLGRQPVDALHDDRVLSIYLACGAMSPNSLHEYDDLCSALEAGEREPINDRTPYAGTIPEGPEAGRSLLKAITDEAATRVEARLREHQVRHALDGPDRRDRLAFDGTDEGERLRRYQLAQTRTLFRAINAVFRLRREAEAAGATAAGCRGEAPEASKPTGETKPVAEGPSPIIPEVPCSEGRHFEPAIDPGPPIRPGSHAAPPPIPPMVVRLVRETAPPTTTGGGSPLASGDPARPLAVP